jgi:hypothetical protein
MKRSRLFVAYSTLSLTLVAIFATKANNKFTLIFTAKVGSHVANPLLYADAFSPFTTVQPRFGAQVSINVYTTFGPISNSTGILSSKLFTAAKVSPAELYWR